MSLGSLSDLLQAARRRFLKRVWLFWSGLIHLELFYFCNWPNHGFSVVAQLQLAAAYYATSRSGGNCFEASAVLYKEWALGITIARLLENGSSVKSPSTLMSLLPSALVR